MPCRRMGVEPTQNLPSWAVIWPRAASGAGRGPPEADAAGVPAPGPAVAVPAVAGPTGSEAGAGAAGPDGLAEDERPVMANVAWTARCCSSEARTRVTVPEWRAIRVEPCTLPP